MTTGPLRILLAEDVAADAELCVDALKKAGFSVNADTCGNAEDFERLISTNDYDVILADYNLANWTGTEAMEIVRRMGKNIPTIVVTGYLGDEKAVDCIHRGAADYVLKDRLSRLPSAVRRAIDEYALRGQSRLLAAAVRSVKEGILIAQAGPGLSNAKIVSLNEGFAQITGYTSAELIGNQFRLLQKTEVGADFFADCETKLLNLDLFVAETVHERKDGSVYDAEWQISPIREGPGRISHFVVIHRDITDRKRTSTELAHSHEELVRYSEELKDATDRSETASRVKSDFLASISHEIRTPMNAIIGIADLLSETELTQKQAKYVEVFQRAGENLLVLINQLLDLSKIESGRFELENIEFDLNAVLAKTTALFEVPTQAKGLSLSVRVACNTPTKLIGDPYQLQQVLINLVGNALKFTETGSITVEVSLSESPSTSNCSLEFKVTDTGVGIPDEKRALIFETFTQGDSSITRQYGGTGLGLTISRALVERMKGNIAVESTVGVGSVFRFAATFGLQSDRPNVRSESTPWRVLLCEDSQDNAFLVSAYLEGNNFVLEHVPDGRAGVDRFKSGAFDVVLMDMQMPVLDGHAATQRIRQWESDHSREPTPILALTAHAQMEEVKRCEACGCTAFLSKPIRKATLLAALARHLPHIVLTPDHSGVPPEVQELVPGYLRRKRMDLDRLWTAIDAGDYGTISRLGHQLKASGTSYGFDAFSEIGSAIERAGRGHDLAETRRQVDLLAGSVSDALAVGSSA
jgi:PAS domain S-box-containing protein